MRQFSVIMDTMWLGMPLENTVAYEAQFFAPMPIA